MYTEKVKRLLWSEDIAASNKAVSEKYLTSSFVSFGILLKHFNIPNRFELHEKITLKKTIMFKYLYNSGTTLS